LRGTPGSACPQPEPMPLSCPVAPPSQREMHKDGGGVLRHFLRHVLRHVPRHVLRHFLRCVLHVLVESKSRFIFPNDTQAKYTGAPLTRLSGQPALMVRLAASSKRGGNEWAWVVNIASTAAAVWDERTCEVAGGAAQNARAVI